MQSATDADLLLAVLPVAAAALKARGLEDDAEREFRSLPLPLQRYFETADPALQPTAWGGTDLTTLYGYALQRVDAEQEAVVYVAGWVLRHAWQRLAWRRIRQAGGNTWGPGVPALDAAAQHLLGTDAATLHHLWTADPDGAEWVRLWSKVPPCDVAPEQAGLGQPELELLHAAADFDLFDQEEND
jgi:hypothetical protein